MPMVLQDAKFNSLLSSCTMQNLLIMKSLLFMPIELCRYIDPLFIPMLPQDAICLALWGATSKITPALQQSKRE